MCVVFIWLLYMCVVCVSLCMSFLPILLSIVIHILCFCVIMSSRHAYFYPLHTCLRIWHNVYKSVRACMRFVFLQTTSFLSVCVFFFRADCILGIVQPTNTAFSVDEKMGGCVHASVARVCFVFLFLLLFLCFRL